VRVTATRLNVLFCHGIGNHRASYAAETIHALQERMGACAAEIHWSSVLWGDVLDGRENRLMDACIRGGDLDWKSARREYVIGGLGDACAYLGDERAYAKVHERVADAFRRLPNAPTVVLCHSMGCAVMMDHLYFHAHDVHCAVLFGCNLPLFWLAYPEGDLPLPPIDRVYNLYDSDDLLGYPIKEVSDQTREWVTGEYRISTGTILGAHTGYWTDRDFLSWVSKCLRRELRIVKK
jgi:pimeloyl-ACP methyl ester carboxylesterase